MRSVIISALILGFTVGYNCQQEQSDLAQACSRESEAWREFTNQIVGDVEKDELFRKYISQRKARLDFDPVRQNNAASCTELAKSDEQIMVPDDPIVLAHLCKDRAKFQKYKDINKDKSLHVHLNLELDRAEHRLRVFAEKLKWGEGKENQCTSEWLNVDGSGYEEVAAMVKEYSKENCKNEALYGYMSEKTQQLVRDVGWHIFQDVIDDIDRKYRTAAGIRKRFCSNTIRDCCGDELVEEARTRAIFEAAQLYLKGLVGYFEFDLSQYNRNSVNWADQYKRLCELEHKTEPGSGFYQASESTLRSLHERIEKIRKVLGKGLEQDVCPPLTIDWTVNPPIPELDKKCDKEIRPKHICQTILNSRNEIPADIYHGQYFQELRKYWCSKWKKVQEAKDSVMNAYKPPTCSDEMVSTVTADAEIEIQTSFELLSLQDSADKVKDLKKLMSKNLEVEREFLSKLKRHYKKEVAEQVEPAKLEQSQRALKLITEKIAEVEASGKLKKSKFGPLHWTG